MRVLYFKTAKESEYGFSVPEKHKIREMVMRFGGENHILKGEEREIIENFEKIVRDYDPDRIVGFKQDYDDFPYILKRVEKLGMKFEIGRGKEIKISGKYFRGIILKETIIPGRENIDLFAIAWRDFPRLPTKEIDELAEALGIEFKRIPEFKLEKMPEEKRIEYWEKYVETIEEIANEILPFEEEISSLSGISMDRQIRMTIGELVDKIVDDEMKKREIKKMRIGGKKRYEGGYVWLKKEGVYKNVVYLDFQSMYPNIIKAWNISPETVDSEGELVEVEGVKHHVRKDIEGAIPSLIDRFLRRRLSLKEKMKEKYDKKIDAEQRALKVIVNAMYGYMGWDGASYYNLNAAELIAALARYYIKEVRKIIEERKGEVIYIDTDGIQFIGENVDKIIDEINSRFPLNIEVERIAEKAAYWSKKKYVHLMDGKIIATGMEFVRKDYPPIVKRAQREIVEKLMHGDEDGAREIRRKYRKKISNKDVEIEDLAIVEQLTKKPEEYEKATKASMAAKIIEEKLGIEVHRGTNIYIVITRGSEGPTFRAKPMEFVKNDEVDWDYYLKIYDDTIKRTFEPFGVSIEKRWF